MSLSAILLGGAWHAVGILRDITEHKRVMEMLQESEAVQRKILETIDVGIVVVDPENHVIEFVNSAATTMFGAAADDITGRACHQFLCPAEIGKCPITDEGKSVKNAERIIIRKDGSCLPVIKSVKRIELWGKIRLIETFIDISKRKTAEESLRNANDRLLLATKAGEVGIWDYDVANDRLVWDDQMYRLYGITPDQFGGAYEAWQKGLHPDDRQRGDEEIQSALRGEKDFNTEFRVMWPDGSVHNIRAMAPFSEMTRDNRCG